jgi:hypothetical protein
MAQLIPERKLFIVTSALNATLGAITPEERLEQTIQGLKTIRKVVPESIVLFVDGSPEKVEEEKILAISDFVDFVADFSTDDVVSQFAKHRKKSEAENALMLKTLLLLKQEPNMMRMLQSVNRIFKLSARTDLSENFNPYEHDIWGKYVFKNRIPTWIQSEKSEFFTDLLITRLFSFCPSLIDDYFITCRRNIEVIMDTGVDTEHAHFFNINRELLVEIDKLNCQGIVATTNTLEIY